MSADGSQLARGTQAIWRELSSTYANVHGNYIFFSYSLLNCTIYSFTTWTTYGTEHLQDVAPFFVTIPYKVPTNIR